jgi:hypothetical protein
VSDSPPTAWLYPGSAIRATALGLCLLTLPASAQEYGQWWWEGRIGYGAEGYLSQVDGVTSSDFEQRDLELAADLHGYLLHPRVGRFSLGLEGQSSELDGSRSVDTDRWGGHFDLDLFEGGAYPTRVFFRHRNYSYSDLGERPASLYGAPESLSRWGARSRIRKGLLRGLFYGFEHTGYDLLEAAGEDTDDLRFVDWNRPLGTLRHHVRLEHRERQLSAGRLGLEDLTLTLGERGELGKQWNWNMDGSSVFRTATLSTGRQLDFDFQRVANRLLRPFGDRDRLEIRHTWSRFAPQDGDISQSHLLSLYYRWQATPRWELAPFVEYGRRQVDGETLEAPRLGLSAAWRRDGRKVDLFLSGRVSYGQLDRQDDSGRRSDRETGLGLLATASHQGDGGFRQEIELEAQRNELDFSSGPRFDVPNLGLPRDGLGTEDRLRGRLTLGHHWSRSWVEAYGEWSGERCDGAPGVADFEADTLTFSASWGGPRVSATAHGGSTMVQRRDATDEEVSFYAASLNWRPWHFFSLNGTYRRDDRQVELLPTLEGDQAQVEATFHLGRLDLSARLFRTFQQVEDGGETISDGFQIRLTRRFAGWLPVVTGDRRRGVIR